MDKILKDKFIMVCDRIRDDCEKDIKNLEGKPFEGKIVAQMFGYQSAAIAILSDIVKEIINHK